MAVLQERIRTQHARLGRLTPEDDGYLPAVRVALDSTFELIDYEEQLPLLMDEPRRAASLRTVRYAGYVTAGAGALTAAGIMPGWVSRWWLLLAVPVLLAAAVLLRTPVPPAGGPHAGSADAALVIVAAALAVPLLGLGAVAAPIAALAAPALLLGVRAVLQEPQEPPDG
jgi:hypothetical protein